MAQDGIQPEDTHRQPLSRRRFLLTVVGSSAGAFLVACGAAPATTPSASGATTTAAGGAATSAPAATVGGAVTSAPAVAAGGAGAPVQVTYTFINYTPLPDLLLVEDAMNATDQFKKANLRIKLTPIDGASYDQKLQLSYTAGEVRDVVFTAPWINNYVQNSFKGNFLPLDDIIQTNAPELFKSMPVSFWNAAKVNGKLYGVPNQNYLAYQYGVFIRKDLADKYASTLPETISTYADLEPFLAKVKANEPNVTPIYLADGPAGGSLVGAGLGVINGFDVVTSTNSMVGIRYDDPQRKAFNMYESPEYKQIYQLRWKWSQAGYYKKDILPSDQGTAEVQAGKYAMLLGQESKPNDIPAISARFGQDFAVKAIGKSFLTTSSIQQNMNAIVRTTQHPDKALQFLNLLNTDPVIFNLLAHGIEGKHYVFKDKAKKLIAFPDGVTASNSGYNPSSDWMFGNEQNGYYTDPKSLGIFEGIQKANAAAKVSTAFGFVFDPTPVKTEIAQLAAILDAMTKAINSGRVNPDTDIQPYLDQVKQAGSDKVVAEVQKQVDAWAKTQTS